MRFAQYRADKAARAHSVLLSHTHLRREFFGLAQVTSVFYVVLCHFGITPSLEILCAFLGPLLSLLTTWLAFDFVKLVKDDTCSLVAAFLVASVPALVRPTSAGLFGGGELSHACARTRKLSCDDARRFAASVGIWLSLFAAYMYAVALRDPNRIFNFVSIAGFEAGLAAIFARVCWPVAAWLPVAAALHAAMLLGIKCVTNQTKASFL